MATPDSLDMGALPPPPGVQPNFNNAWSEAPAFHGVNIFLVVLISLTTFTRVYTRACIVKKMTPSDYTMILAYCCFLVFFALLDQAFRNGGGSHQWDVTKSQVAKFDFWAQILDVFHCFCIASVRITVCLQFILIFIVGRNRLWWTIWTFLGINIAYYFMYIFVSLFQCRPVAKLFHDELPGSCIGVVYQRFIVATGVFNLIGDTCMFIFPLYCIRTLLMPSAKRWATAWLFAVGIFAPVASSFRLAFSVANLSNSDQTYTLAQVGECVFAEISAGILVGNLVTLPRFIDAAKETIQVYFAAWRARFTGSSRLPSGNGLFDLPHHQPSDSDVELYRKP